MKWRWVVFFTIVAGIYVLSSHILKNVVVLPSFERLEKEEAEKDFRRCVDALTREVQALGSTTTDYSVWDDTYDFVESRNTTYLNSNYRWPFVEEKVRINMVSICDVKGRPIWEMGHAPRQTAVLLMGELLQQSSRDHLLGARSMDALQGFVRTAHGPLLVASHAIMPSTGEGTSRGTLMMGRLLTQDLVDHLEKQTHVRFQVSTDPEVCALPAGTSEFVAADADRALVRGCVAGLTEGDRLAIVAEIPRTIMSRGRDAALTLSVTLVVGALLIGLLGALLLQRTLRAEALTRALGESEERFKLAIAGANLGTWDWNVPSGVYRLNPRWAEMLGYRMEDVEPHLRSWEQLLHPDDRTRALQVLQDHVEGKTPVYHNEYRLRHASGGWVWVLSTGRVMARDARGKPVRVCGTHLDITGRREAEERRQRTEAQVWHAQKLESLGVLAGGIAHDFNNLLVGILGNADLALRETPATSRAHEQLKGIQLAARRAGDLCRQMLAYAGQGNLVVEPVGLNEVVDEMLRMLGLSIARSAQLECHLDPRLPPVQADVTQIRQVVMNLIVNASDAMEERSGNITVSTGVCHCTREYLSESSASLDCPEGRYVFFEVRDDGCGMAPDVRARIFDPFFTTKSMGRGLGMAATLGIVRGHQGGINIQSVAGKGTTIRVVLPVLESGAKPALAVEPAITEWRGQGLVLVVDDDGIVREVAEQMLHIMGFEVLKAVDGREALRICRRERGRIVCILLDLAMPVMDGVQAYTELRRIDPDVKVLLSSGFSAQEVEERFRGKGLAGFIQKPYELEALQAKLREVLD
jgi:PAS domain S-box-containing protein